ncbi:MAG: DUF4384 domain-containing protein [Geobacter sp.]|nr:DUF4384 domain-containing protein [Geobacter sp.]
MIIRFVAVIGLLLLSIMPSHAFWSSEPASLKELAAGVAAEMKEKAGAGKKLYLDKANVKDAVTGETANLSAFLVNELESSLSAAGFSFSDFMEQADQVVGASYQRDGGRLRVFVKYCPVKDSSNCKALSAALPLSALPKESFSESLDSKLKRLVQKTSGTKNGLKVFINPVVERKARYASEFSEYVTARVRSMLVNGQQFEVLEEQPVTRSLSNTRGLVTKAKEVQNLETSAALFSGADAVLEGYYLEGAGHVTVAMTLKNLKGGLIGSADETFERSMIPYSTVNQTADSLASVADVAGQVNQQMVKLHTTKGDRFQVYRAGEKVQFLMQVAKPLYVYLYGINAKNEVSQLYPGPGQKQVPLQPGRVHTVPSEWDNWEIMVEPPFGTDVVKLFASERPLAIPIISGKIPARSFSDGTRTLVRRDLLQQELAGQKSINGFDLVDYYKGVAGQQGVLLYEDSLFVQTRPR